MSYYKKVLQPDEKIIYNKKLHEIIYLPSILVAAIGVVACLIAKGSQDGPTSGISVGSFLIFVAFLLFIRAWVLRLTTEIVVTDKRVIMKRGLILVATLEMNMSKVESVDVIQSLLGRAFNYGTVIVRGTGSSFEPLDGVASPIELRNTIVVK